LFCEVEETPDQAKQLIEGGFEYFVWKIGARYVVYSSFCDEMFKKEIGPNEYRTWILRGWEKGERGRPEKYLRTIEALRTELKGNGEGPGRGDEEAWKEVAEWQLHALFSAVFSLNARACALWRVSYERWFNTHLPEQRYQFASMVNFLFENMNQNVFSS
jgi:hypothetical protein